MKEKLFKLYSIVYWLVFGKKPDRLVEKFKEEILKMHDGIPRYYFFGIYSLIDKPELQRYYHDKNVIVKSKDYKFIGKDLVKLEDSKKQKNCKDAFFLGINGMILANSYINERLTLRITLLTIILVIVTVVLLFISI